MTKFLAVLVRAILAGVLRAVVLEGDEVERGDPTIHHYLLLLNRDSHSLNSRERWGEHWQV